MNHWLKRYVKKTNANTVGAVETPDEVVVFVKRKMPLAEIELKLADKEQKEWRKKDIVSDKLRTGLLSKKKTDVVEIGEVVAQLDRNKYRPVKGGCEIQPKGAKHVGTAGAIVNYYSFRGVPLVGWKKSFVRILDRMNMQVDVKKGILTNAHVANKDSNKLVLNTQINQPYEEGSIGQTILNMPLGPRFDASLISLSADSKQEVLQVGEIINFREPKENEEVHKYGRTTSYTEGTIKYLGATISVDYDTAGVKQIDDCVIISRMSDSGDSGSVIVSKEDDKAVALLFAGSSRATIAQPIDKVMEAMGIWL